MVCDVRAEATEQYGDRATVAASPAELVRQSDVVVVAVVNDEQVHAVLSGPDGGLAAADPDTTFIIVSTISAPCVEAIGAEAAALGVPVLDCGVSGGPAAAATGELVCMVGGDPAAIERVRPVFDAISSLTVAMGPFGSGLAAKLARNLVHVRIVVGRLRGPAPGRGGRHRAGQAGRGGQGQRRPHRRCVDRSCSARRWRPSPTTTTRDWSAPCGRRRRWPTRTWRPPSQLAETLGIDLPLAEMAEDALRPDLRHGDRSA